MSVSLHHAALRSESHEPPRSAALFLHGILGSGTNLRPVAQAFLRSHPDYVAVLVDLRAHGRSQGFSAPHTLAACARDLCELEARLAAPVRAVVGHSFGGKVALAYHAERPQLEQVALLDSSPSARSAFRGAEQTLSAIELLESMPPRFERREDFTSYVRELGHSKMFADWLAMNLERTSDGFRLRTDTQVIRALLDDYFERDQWSIVERSRARIDVVIGARGTVWDEPDQKRLSAVCAESRGRVRMHVLDAGHWVHVDDLEGVARALVL